MTFKAKCDVRRQASFSTRRYAKMAQILKPPCNNSFSADAILTRSFRAPIVRGRCIANRLPTAKLKSCRSNEALSKNNSLP